MSLPPLWGNVPRALLKLFGLSGPEQRCPPLNIEKEIRARTDDTLSFLLSSSALSTLLHSSLCLSPSFFHDNRPYFSSGSFIFSSSSDLYQLRISLEYESVRSLKRVKPRRFFSSQNSIVFSLDERKIDPCLFFFFWQTRATTRKTQERHTFSWTRIVDKRDETNKRTFLHLLRLNDSLPCWRPIDRNYFPFGSFSFSTCTRSSHADFSSINHAINQSIDLFAWLAILSPQICW